MNSSTQSLIPLQAANLCLDCETITAAHARCVACGSVALLNVARALSRPSTRQFSGGDRPSPVQIVTAQAVRSGDFLHST
jgi:hypothetical protein